MLESQLVIFERDRGNVNLQTSWVHRYQYSWEDRRVCRCIERITANVSSIFSLLDIRSATAGSTIRNPTPPRGRCHRRASSQNQQYWSETSADGTCRVELTAPFIRDEEPMFYQQMFNKEVSSVHGTMKIHTPKYPTMRLLTLTQRHHHLLLHTLQYTTISQVTMLSLTELHDN